VASSEVVELRSSELRAAFAPNVGMVGCSLTHRGEELLGQRDGLAGYRERGSTFGIPLLYPWANRLGAYEYSAGGRAVELARDSIKLDPNGLPIHGLLAAYPGWEVSEADTRSLVARLDWAADPRLMAGFPWPHELRLEVELSGGELTVATSVAPATDDPVPVSFGWHPYLRLPGVPRPEWRVELPVRARAELDERGLPTGAVEAVAPPPGPLGDRSYDDLFPELASPAVFALEGGDRRIEVELLEGYPLAQVYAPPGQELICFEPMTAPTNALVTGGGLRWAPAGEGFRATFRIRVRS